MHHPILQFPLHYRENCKLEPAAAAVGEVPPSYAAAYAGAVNAAQQLQHQHMHASASNPVGPPHTSASQRCQQSALHGASARERFLQRIRREAELLASPSSNSCARAVAMFPHLFASPATAASSDAEPPAAAAGLLAHSPLLLPASWKSHSISYDLLRTHMKKIVHIQAQVVALIAAEEAERRDRLAAKLEPTALSDPTNEDQSILDARQREHLESTSKPRPDRTPKAPATPAPLSPGPAAATAKDDVLDHSASIRASPCFQGLLLAHAAFWTLLRAEVERFQDFAGNEVHLAPTEGVWAGLMVAPAPSAATTAATTTTATMTEGVQEGAMKAEDGSTEAASVATGAPVGDMSDSFRPECPCGCGASMAQEFQVVLTEIVRQGLSPAVAPVAKGEVPVVPSCPLARRHSQLFVASLLHMDMLRRFLAHNYVIYQRVLEQYAHYTANSVVDRVSANMNPLAVLPPVDSAVSGAQGANAPAAFWSVQQWHAQAFLSSSTPYSPVYRFLQRMVRASLVAERVFNRGTTWTNVSEEMQYTIAAQAQAQAAAQAQAQAQAQAAAAAASWVGGAGGGAQEMAFLLHQQAAQAQAAQQAAGSGGGCGLCFQPVPNVSILLPCAHSFCFGCLVIQSSFGVHCPHPRCQRELQMNDEMKCRLSMEEWIAGEKTRERMRVEQDAAERGDLTRASMQRKMLDMQLTQAHSHSHAQGAGEDLAVKSSPSALSGFSSSDDGSGLGSGQVAPLSLGFAPGQGQGMGVAHQQGLSQQTRAELMFARGVVQRAGGGGGFQTADLHLDSGVAARMDTSHSRGGSRANSPAAAATGRDRAGSGVRAGQSRRASSSAARRRHSLSAMSDTPPQGHSRSRSGRRSSEEAGEADPSSVPFEVPLVHPTDPPGCYSLVADRLYSAAPFGAHHRSDENSALIANHAPCDGDDRPIGDEDLLSGNFILGCGGTIAAPLQYEECTVIAPDGSESVQHRPKRGQGYSCHHCKTTKEPLALFFCSNLVKKGKNLKKCRKKYCESCLKRLYAPDFGEGGRYWSCPSCKGACVCASCERKITGRAAPKKKKNPSSAAAEFDGNAMDDQSDAQSFFDEGPGSMDGVRATVTDAGYPVPTHSAPHYRHPSSHSFGAMSGEFSVDPSGALPPAPPKRRSGGRSGNPAGTGRTPTKIRSRSTSVEVGLTLHQQQHQSLERSILTGRNVSQHGASDFSPLSVYHGSEAASPNVSPSHRSRTPTIHKPGMQRHSSNGVELQQHHPHMRASSRSRGSTPLTHASPRMPPMHNGQYAPLSPPSHMSSSSMMGFSNSVSRRFSATSTSTSSAPQSHSSSPFPLVHGASGSAGGNVSGDSDPDSLSPSNAAHTRSVSPQDLANMRSRQMQDFTLLRNQGLAQHTLRQQQLNAHNLSAQDGDSMQGGFTLQDHGSSLDQLSSINARLSAMQHHEEMSADSMLPPLASPNPGAPNLAASEHEMLEIEQQLMREQQRINVEQAALHEQQLRVAHVKAQKALGQHGLPPHRSTPPPRLHAHTPPPLAMTIQLTSESSALDANLPSLPLPPLLTNSHVNSSGMQLETPNPLSTLVVPRARKASDGMLSPLDAPLLSPNMLDALLSPVYPAASPFPSQLRGGCAGAATDSSDSSSTHSSQLPAHASQLSALNMTLMTPVGHQMHLVSPGWPAAHFASHQLALSTPAAWNAHDPLATPMKLHTPAAAATAATDSAADVRMSPVAQ